MEEQKVVFEDEGKTWILRGHVVLEENPLMPGFLKVERRNGTVYIRKDKVIRVDGVEDNGEQAEVPAD